MAAKGKRREPSALERATLAELHARKALSDAKKTGDQAAVTAAAERVDQAAQTVTAIHRQRFEKNAKLRADTALNAMTELAKLAQQQRYTVTAEHVGAILTPLREQLDALAVALHDAARRQRPKTGISFGNAQGATAGEGATCL